MIFSFFLAMAGAVIYFTESSNYTAWFNQLFGVEHKYTKLLLISIVVLAGGSLAFLVGWLTNPRSRTAAEAAV